MKPNDPDLEARLRQAPRPAPPADLRQDILRTIPAPRAAAVVAAEPGWLARWFNSWRIAAVAGCLALATLGVAARQQMELRELRREIEALRQKLESQPAPAPAAPAPGAIRPTTANAATATPPSERNDLSRLRAEAERLQAEKTALSQLLAENQKLKTELATLTSQVLPEDFAAMREARERAQRISCVNNLKQLGLAVRLYANDNRDAFPPDMLAMTNELSTTKILVCPADPTRKAAESWAAFGPATMSYEYLAPDGDATDPTRVLFRCLVHRGSVGLIDGSVQQLNEQRQNDRLINRNGKLYLTSPGGGR